MTRLAFGFVSFVIHEIIPANHAAVVVENLGIKTTVQTSPPVASVTDLVPNENKSELMDRFFSSQKVEEEVRSEGMKSEPPSRPSTAVEEVSSSEAEASSAGPLESS